MMHKLATLLVPFHSVHCSNTVMKSLLLENQSNMSLIHHSMFMIKINSTMSKWSVPLSGNLIVDHQSIASFFLEQKWRGFSCVGMLALMGQSMGLYDSCLLGQQAAPEEPGASTVPAKPGLLADPPSRAEVALLGCEGWIWDQIWTGSDVGSWSNHHLLEDH